LKDPELLDKLDKEETGGYSVVAEKAEGIGGAWVPWAWWQKLAKTHGFSRFRRISRLEKVWWQVGGWNFLKDW